MSGNPVLPPGSPGAPRRFTDEVMRDFVREYLAPGANRSQVARNKGYKYVQNAAREVRRFLRENPDFLSELNQPDDLPKAA